MITLTDDNFDQHFTQSKLLILDFWAPWCEPCKDFSKIFFEVAQENQAPDTYFGSINVDQEKKLAKDFSIRSVPTTAIIRDQVVVFIQSGVMPKKAFVDLLKQARELPEVISF
jgi:thioredoxin 1